MRQKFSNYFSRWWRTFECGDRRCFGRRRRRRWQQRVRFPLRVLRQGGRGLPMPTAALSAGQTDFEAFSSLVSLSTMSNSSNNGPKLIHNCVAVLFESNMEYSAFKRQSC